MAEEKDAFVGVSPEYANYANDTDKPVPSTGAEGKVEERVRRAQDRNQVEYNDMGVAVVGNVPTFESADPDKDLREDEDDEDKDEQKKASAKPAAKATAPKA